MKENHFPHRISKDLVHWMPLVAFEGETYVINTIEQVPEAVDWLNQQTIVGVDTETRPSFRRGQHYPVALVADYARLARVLLPLLIVNY